jgi:aminopeptidase N
MTSLVGRYEQGNELRAEFGPVALPARSDLLGVFSDNVYNGGAIVLYALYQRVGEATFYEIQRRWAHTYRGESVSTAQFIDHVVRVARDGSLAPFLEEWLYGTTVPPMPGHPDWVADPVAVAAPAARSAAPSARQLEGARLLKR